MCIRLCLDIQCLSVKEAKKAIGIQFSLFYKGFLLSSHLFQTEKLPPFSLLPIFLILLSCITEALQPPRRTSVQIEPRLVFQSITKFVIFWIIEMFIFGWVSILGEKCACTKNDHVYTRAGEFQKKILHLDQNRVFGPKNAQKKFGSPTPNFPPPKFGK